ncbi:MAG: TonB-dependent receptor [Saprospiraceae bacterium]|nr:TonB-dependent receptor [Saprospiraceae bacterium]
MWNKLILFLVFIQTSIPVVLKGQPCNLVIRGFISDESTGIPLEYATLFIQETKQGASADSLGYFVIKGICPGEYHIQISHLACETENLFIHLTQDTFLLLRLHHHAELLNEIAVHGSREDNSSQIINSLSKEDISKSSNKNLADLLEKIAGVSLIKNGSGISKPVIHGLYGNRISIVNNGLIQGGQQWGNDHAPEIDPFMADHLSVIKGVGALAYGGNGLGGIVLAESNPIPADPHLHGQANYIFQSNGRGHTLNTQFQRKQTWASWRLTGTLKLLGDHRTPDYYLTNTGKNEKNLGVQLEKKLSPRWSSRLYYSLFDTEIGILRGSHIGNVTDLEEAIGRSIPFFTRDEFSYPLESPRQDVLHHLLKLENKFFLHENEVFSFNYGSQLNRRQEFDVRRSGRSDVPALSLKQYSHFLEGVYNKSTAPGRLLKTGLQLTYVDNTNNPETGILPLIPDYQSYTASVFGILQQEKNKVQWEIGMRYDFKDIDAVTISKSLPRTIIRYHPVFHNLSGSIGGKFKFTPNIQLTTNLGYVLRSPEVNELFSSGLHQGVSGLEEGNPNLNQEKSIKAIVSLDASSHQKLFFQLVGYYHSIRDYIYLQPQPEFRLTIRGAFPVFSYLQTNAILAGTDFLCSYEFNKKFKWTSKFSFISGQDRSRQQPLVYMPGNQVQTDLTYSPGDRGHWSNPYFTVHGRYVFRQNRFETGQDFLSPPDGYSVFNLEGGTGIAIRHSILKLSIQLENVLNTVYRDYLNRLRYFADETGINANFRINYTF